MDAVFILAGVSNRGVSGSELQRGRMLQIVGVELPELERSVYVPECVVLSERVRRKRNICAIGR